MLERICAGEGACGCVTAVHAFGSWSRGAPHVGDVDLDVEYESSLDPAVDEEVVRRLVDGRDWNTPVRQALRPRRTLQVLFNRLDMVADTVLIYERGDTLAQALARIDAIAVSSDGGRAPRDPVHPTLEPVVEELARPTRILLTEMLSRGYIDVEVVQLPDAELDAINDSDYHLTVHVRWSQSSPLARAAIAGGVWLQARSVPLGQVKLLGRVVGDEPPVWALEAREHKLRSFVYDMGHAGVGDWLFVIAPAHKRPLRGLHIVVADKDGLSSIESLEVWLSENAPHISRLG